MTSPRVTDFIDQLDASQKTTAQRLRDLVHEAVDACEEDLKWGKPSFINGKPFAYIAAHKAHVNLGFYDGAALTDPKGLLEGTGKKMRHVKITDADAIDTEGLTALLRQAAEAAGK